ncbi:MAG: stage II sporulation protein P [Clostridia bacterium]|nr:stage II sporulation protein P [Clostridia bacterium]
MKCFVVTKKHIAAALSAAVIIPLSVFAIKNTSREAAAPVFKLAASEILSEALPTNDDPSIITKLKDFFEKEKNKKSADIISEFAPIFPEAAETHQPEEAKQDTPETEPAPPEETAIPEPTPEPVPIQIEEKTTSSNAAQIKNDTSYEINAEDFADEQLEFPQTAEVLIVHTHTTESYAPENSVTEIDNSRSVDEQKNIVAVGETIREQLEGMGIKVIHDKTVHDYPSYQGAYGRSLTTIKKNAESNKNICIILDVHRDAIVKSDGTRVKLSAEVAGKKCAQVMIVCGTNGTGLSHPGWQNNLNFAVKIQNKAAELYPGLMRPINLREERFNQHITSGSLILEIGTNGNTLTEAKNGAALAADALGRVILEGMK